MDRGAGEDSRPERAHGGELEAARVDLGAETGERRGVLEGGGHVHVARDARYLGGQVELEGRFAPALRGLVSGGSHLDPANADEIRSIPGTPEEVELAVNDMKPLDPQGTGAR